MLSASAQSLANRYARLRLREVGTTEAGRPLHVLTIRGLEKSAPPVVLLLGTSPAEDTSWAGLRLARRLAQDPRLLSAHTVHILLSCDPDGAALNEGRGARSLHSYYLPLGYHAPCPAEQPARQLPLESGGDDTSGPAPVAATLALQRVLDEVVDGAGEPLVVEVRRCAIGRPFAITGEPQPFLQDGFAGVMAALEQPVARGLWELGELAGARVQATNGEGVFRAPPALSGTDAGVLGDPLQYAKIRSPRARTLTLNIPQFRGRDITRTGREIGQWLQAMDHELRAQALRLGDLSTTCYGRAFAAHHGALTELARKESGRRRASGPWPLTALLGLSSSLASHACAPDRQKGVRPRPEVAQMHARAVRYVDALTQARPVPGHLVDDALFAVLAVTLHGKRGMEMVAPP
ncbi:hypothetical protein ACIP5N_21415 [Streptomyces sp. NPDC088768]|uniref:hypothetical protein n=1 Tax=Streptomyces sp. NPDC088768 TaxID=3365894 RepID=UPI00380174FB